VNKALPIFLAATFLCRAALCQQPASDAVFEVATVKPAPPNQPGFNIEPGDTTLTMHNVTIRIAMQFAYNLHEYQISGGPKWVNSDGFDIIGKSGESLHSLSFTDRIERHRIMLRNLLAERFHLTLRREMKPVPAYSLSVVKTGFPLKAVQPGGPTRTYGHPNQLVAEGVSIAGFVALLEARFQQPVLNRTGIEGLYNFRVQFAPDNVADSPDPSIFTALQEQCGLKLERTTAPAETFFIERLEKPSEN
jgi:uncharacterized protein (TIGR03435 family)